MFAGRPQYKSRVGRPKPPCPPAGTHVKEPLTERREREMRRARRA